MLILTEMSRLGNPLVQFWCSFSAVLMHFWCTFSAVQVQFKCNFSAVLMLFLGAVIGAVFVMRYNFGVFINTITL